MYRITVLASINSGVLHEFMYGVGRYSSGALPGTYYYDYSST